MGLEPFCYPGLWQSSSLGQAEGSPGGGVKTEGAAELWHPEDRLGLFGGEGKEAGKDEKPSTGTASP